MTTYAEARDEIVNHLSANYSATPIFYENTEEIDLNISGDRFIRVVIDFNLSRQASMGGNAMDRTHGFIVFHIFTKRGLGVRGTLGLIDSLNGILKNMPTSKIQCETITPGNVENKNGWERREMLAPFWFDSAH